MNSKSSLDMEYPKIHPEYDLYGFPWIANLDPDLKTLKVIFRVSFAMFENKKKLKKISLILIFGIFMIKKRE